MSHRIEIKLKAVDGALIRALGLIERRGFRILDIEAKATDDAGFQRTEIGISSDGRSVATLLKQLDKLYDVLAVRDLAGAFGGFESPSACVRALGGFAVGKRWDDGPSTARGVA